MAAMDYKKIGLKCGIEIHQQLNTHKLFCDCNSSMSENPSGEIVRRLRAVAGELGEIDLAALHELSRGMEFHYKTYPSETCLVEEDEEPPHPLNSEALDISLQIAMMLNCEIPEELHIMRKIVIDGSNTAGFQRTVMIGSNGWIETNFGKVGITNLCLEEDAAQILKKEKNIITYGLNRLGIPLVEIGTHADIKTPEQAKEVAAKLGMVLRSTGKVKRGLGTIRQDINISIKDGARIEIKGAQNLGLIPRLIEYEVKRQLSLLKIRNSLRQIGFKPVKPVVQHVTHIFKESESRITQNKTTFAILIPGFAGILKTMLTPTRTLGNEIANYVRVKTGLKGIIHSDEELERYKLTHEFDKLSKHLKAKKGDTLIIAVGEKSLVKKTMDVIAERINQLIIGVPEETRKALENGDTEYMRPLPGSARMYPETDIPPINVSKLLKDIKSRLPELWEEKLKRFVKKYRINTELAKQVVYSDKGDVFEYVVKLGFKPRFVATILTSGLVQLKRKEKIPIENLSSKHLIEIFRVLKTREITKESLLDILKQSALNPREKIRDLIKKSGTETISVQDLRKIIKKIIKENKKILLKPRPEKILMGLIMKDVRGKIPGKVVARILKEEIGK
jgi:glutamyl-tRNA(Gln) amidotransferase subunit E